MVIEAAAGGAFTKLMQPIVDETFVVKDARNSAWLPMAIVGLFLLRGIAGYLTDYNMARARRGIAHDLRVQDRTSGVQGQSVSVQVDLGGSRNLKTKKSTDTFHYNTQ